MNGIQYANVKCVILNYTQSEMVTGKSFSFRISFFCIATWLCSAKKTHKHVFVCGPCICLVDCRFAPLCCSHLFGLPLMLLLLLYVAVATMLEDICSHSICSVYVTFDRNKTAKIKLFIHAVIIVVVAFSAFH